MILNIKNLSSINADNVEIPQSSLFNLPEKVLQFGTGVLLRGLPDFFIDKANRQGVFNGRVVVVKSTDYGTTKDFDDQDGLYTLSINGIENGNAVAKNIISSAISRVLTASTQWQQILDLAVNKDLEIVISNTTEVGIVLTEDNITSTPPLSFPGKLLAVLHHRFLAFNGAADKGLVIVPTELIVDNGTKLTEVLFELAKQNNLSDDFINWLKNHNEICNSLVDCIVPGKPAKEELEDIESELGYKDDLLVMSEVYRLWAIQGNEKTKEKLSFAKADKGVVITPDIDLHRELKLRLLNGTHTLSCGLAFLAGCDTVKSAMDDEAIEAYVANLMRNEIAPAIPYQVTEEQTTEFATNVLDRFKNPYINHQWLSITANYSSKLKMRVLPVLLNYVQQFNKVPELIAMGFAAYIRFMKPVSDTDNKFFGEANGQQYHINDTKASHLAQLWKNNADNIVVAVLGDVSLWGKSLTEIPEFSQCVEKHLKSMDSPQVIKEIITKNKSSLVS
ncbi:tagaturonate reductase [Pedobacter alpinus]|uniref:Tagaturonate reductase n=1 Tax=Pedobacter alpinus TaxID=1590643 RepID=A0ABW5TTX8_9SPHI